MHWVVRIALAAAVSQTACQYQSDGTGDTAPVNSISVRKSDSHRTTYAAPASSIAVPRSGWPDFVAGLDGLRIVPEVSRGTLVGIRCFYVDVPQAAEMGLAPGDNLIAINGTPVGGRPSADAATFLRAELDRSEKSCSISFAVEHQGTTRVVSAHCHE